MPFAAVLTHWLLDPIAEIDALAAARNVDGLAKLASPELVKSDAFRFLKRGGSYGVGGYGWHAYKLTEADGSREYVVFSTALTCEDIGEQVFTLVDGKLDARLPELEDFGCKVKDWDISVKFNTKTQTADLKAVTLFRSTKSGPFQVRFSPNYKVKRVQDSSGKPVKFNQAGGVVSLLRPRSADFRYTFDYTAKVNLKSFAGDMSDGEMMLTEDYWYPMVARGPATHSVTVEAPLGWTVVAQGDEVSKKISGSVQTVKFHMSVPCSYLSLAAGNYKKVSRTVDGRTYQVWSKLLSQDQLETQLDFQVPVIQFYDKVFGPMPFKSYGQLVTGLYSGGALEAYSYATYGPGWLPAEDAHEPAHTWFGGMLDNTYLRSFWNESFANWCDGYFHRFSPFGKSEETQLALMPTPFANPDYWQASCQAGSVDIGPAAGSLGYGKGSEVLLQMEQEFPDMLKWVKQWVAERPMGNPSEWTDFEKVCGPEAKWFFDQWIRRKGFPKFALSQVRYEDGKVKGHVHFDGDPYRLTVDVLTRGTGGDKTHKVVLSPDQTPDSDFEFLCDAKPQIVAFDPWQRLLIARPEGTRTTLQSFLTRSKFFLTSDANKWMPTWGGWPNVKNATMNKPSDWSGYTFVGDPGEYPELVKALREKGIVLSDGKAVYKGTSVDLNNGAIGAVLNLGGEKNCAIVIGKTKIRPNLGHARLGVFDNLGRLLRAETDLETKGPLSFKLSD